jgi:hypothetical protein
MTPSDGRFQCGDDINIIYRKLDSRPVHNDSVVAERGLMSDKQVDEHEEKEL